MQSIFRLSKHCGTKVCTRVHAADEGTKPSSSWFHLNVGEDAACDCRLRALAQAEGAHLEGAGWNQVLRAATRPDRDRLVRPAGAKRAAASARDPGCAFGPAAMPPPGEEHVDEASAIDRAGGVKALLKQLNNKFGDSHVQLPDGTVPTKKIAIAPKKALPSAPQEGHYANGGGVSDASSPPKGVRAMLQKEVKSSFVKLPDGSTPVRKEPLSVTQKDNETQLQYAQLSSDDDYEPAPVQLDLNLQEIEYAAPPAQPAQQRDERDEYNRNSAAPPQLLEQQGSQYHQLQQPPSHLQEYQLQSSPELSDYPARANDPGVWPRGPSPPEQPVLSDYPQQQGYMQPGQPMERGHRPAGGRVSSQQIQVAASSQKLNQQDGPSAPPGSASTQRVIGPEDVYKQGSSRKVIRETVVREQRVVGEVKHKQHDKEPASKSRTEREPMGGKEVPTMHNQLPAPPPLLHGQGPQYTPNTRPGYPGGLVCTFFRLPFVLVIDNAILFLSLSTFLPIWNLTSLSGCLLIRTRANESPEPSAREEVAAFAGEAIASAAYFSTLLRDRFDSFRDRQLGSRRITPPVQPEVNSQRMGKQQYTNAGQSPLPCRLAGRRESFLTLGLMPICLLFPERRYNQSRQLHYPSQTRCSFLLK